MKSSTSFDLLAELLDRYFLGFVWLVLMTLVVALINHQTHAKFL